MVPELIHDFDVGVCSVWPIIPWDITRMLCLYGGCLSRSILDMREISWYYINIGSSQLSKRVLKTWAS